MSARYVCIHGHFYQPPRENPWLETIERQDSAYPYENWNERITAECYAPNAASRILDTRGRIVRIVNNYAQVSYNFGPTLLAWLETNARDTYDSILQADRASAHRFSGHGSALAQAYNHVIMPLANQRDQRTQTLWGIRDFQHRFGRRPEGMWLPETAADIPSLEALAESGIVFTILAPHQCKRVRTETGKWKDTPDSTVDTTRPYRVNLPSGRSIIVFFYNGPVSRAVAFESVLKNGEHFARRLMETFDDRTEPQLSHIATDGETYGHHHRHGDMALAYALHSIESSGQAKLTNYAEYLARSPVTHEAEIVEMTSWSCAHGVERWRSNCGCHTGGQPDWTQEWREPLLHALNWLRDQVAPLYEEKAGCLFRDPWAARDQYIDVILDRSPGSTNDFFAEHQCRPLTEDERTSALKLLELQRHAMLMYTSCGWFFSDLGGIETVQVIQYAGRVVQLAESELGQALREEFLQRLRRARSNVPSQGTGRDIFERDVQRAEVDLFKIGAHYAVSSLYNAYEDEEKLYCYRVKLEDRENMVSGEARLVGGRARITSEVTEESVLATFAVLYFGDHHVHGGIDETQKSEHGYREFMRDLKTSFFDRDFPAVIRHMDERFGVKTFSIRSLFPDSQRRVLDLILESTLTETGNVYRGVYERHAPLMRFLSDLDLEVPAAFRASADYVLNTDLKRVLAAEPLDLERVHRVLDQVRSSQVTVDARGIKLHLERALERTAAQLARDPEDVHTLQTLEDLARIATSIVHDVDVWKVQNIFFDLLRDDLPRLRLAAADGDATAAAWVSSFLRLADQLSVSIPE